MCTLMLVSFAVSTGCVLFLTLLCMHTVFRVYKLCFVFMSCVSCVDAVFRMCSVQGEGLTNNIDITFVTLRLGRVVGPARRQLLAVRRRRCDRRRAVAPASPRDFACAPCGAHARALPTPACQVIAAISHTATIQNINIIF